MQRARLARFPWWLCSIALVLVATGLSRPCAADTNTLRLAAETYDAAVAHFERAEYATAAKLFLEADMLHPSTEALSNAIAAARHANDHLLVARIALRAQARAETAPELAAQGRKALAEAEVHLSRLELSCTPAPCELSLDGDPAPPGRIHVLPGSHRVTARAKEHTQSHDLVTAAAATYRVSLEVVAPTLPAPAERSASPGPSPGDLRQRAQRVNGDTPPLSPAVFYASLGVTGVVAGLTVWSGLDALEQKRELDDPPSEASRDQLVASVRRTDILLISSVLLAATTTYIGWKLVDFHDGSVQAQVSPSSCTVVASRVFW